MNKPDHAVFAPMRAVEIRVRRQAGLGDEDFGNGLMNRAFSPGRQLTDPTAARGEQEGTRSLFSGAYAVLRNPAGHREVDYGDLPEAAGRADRQPPMRILDRVEETGSSRPRGSRASRSPERGADRQQQPEPPGLLSA